MNIDLLATAFGLAIAAGISPYATVAIVAIGHHAGWIGTLPAALAPITSPWVMTLAVALAVIEFTATLVPGVASAWEAVHTAIRPPVAVVLAALVVWGGDPALVLAVGLLGGTLAFGTSLTKLGARLAIDTSPEPVSNGAASLAELGFVGLICVFVWQHPLVATVAGALVVLTMALLVRAVWGLIWGSVMRTRRPGQRGIRS